WHNGSLIENGASIMRFLTMQSGVVEEIILS
ncbi:MAG: hypothetical protein ACI9VT_002937, partial [Psychroserpens sp.]